MNWEGVSKWAVDSITTGWLTWIGTGLALFGLMLTYNQAKDAKDAANAAKFAVLEMEEKFNASNLGYASSQIDTVTRLILSGNISAAQMVFAPVKRTSIDVFVSLSSQTKLEKEIVALRKTVRVIERQMELGFLRNAEYNESALTKSLRGLSEFLAERESEIRHSGLNAKERK